MKKKLRLSKGNKVFFVILQELFAVAMFVCMVLGMLFISETSTLNDLFQRSLRYEDSTTFSNLMGEEVDDVVSYVKLRNNYETNGIYNKKKIVDLKEYYTEGIISGRHGDSVGYYLEDLIKWSQTGLEYESITVLDNKNVAAEPEEGSSVSNMAKEPDTFTDKVVVEEKFIPAKGRKIFDYCDDDLSEEEMLEYLSGTLDRIGQEYQQYKEMLLSFNADRTNIRFYIKTYDKNGVYTNLDTNNYVENETIKSFGKYVILDSKNLEYESNLAVSDSFLYDMLSRYASQFPGDYYIEAAIDTSYPVKDSFVENKESYYSFMPNVRIVSGIGAVAATGALIFLIILSFSAGNVMIEASGNTEKDNARIVLNGFDRIKTEIAASGLLAIAIVGVVLLAAVLRTYYKYTVLVGIFAGVGAAVLNAFFLTGYLSLVRRMKARVLWSNSICAGLIHLCVDILRALRTVFNSRKVATKIILLYIAFLFLNISLISLCVGNVYRELAVILLLGVDITCLILLINSALSRNKILQGIKTISSGEIDFKIPTDKMSGDNLILAEAVNCLGDGLHSAVDISTKNERLKADLITNVSHDIKTPLTSIISYVDLLKREDIQDEKIQGYIKVLDNKSQRLKHLTEDLVEASKISSGNIELNMERINFIELIHQTAGEFVEKFEARNLILIMNLPEESVAIYADGRGLYRVLENLYNNVAKYALENTRVYADLLINNGRVEFSIKNISTQALNINADELTERFIRGDVSRSTEGSGLGLSIARNLTEAQHGIFTIYLDGDLFKVTISFPKL